MEGGIVFNEYYNKTVALHVEGIEEWDGSNGSSNSAGIENAAGLCRIVLVGEGLDVLLSAVVSMDGDLAATLTTVRAPDPVLRYWRKQEDVAGVVNLNCGRHTRVVVHHVRSSAGGDRYAGVYFDCASSPEGYAKKKNILSS